MNLKNLLLVLALIFIVNLSCFCDDKLALFDTIEKSDYKVQLKQYSSKYPVALYVIFKESTPMISEIQKILKEELLIASKSLSNKNTIIASAWFDDQISDNNEKIELSQRNSAFVWVGEEENKIKTFPEYVKYLKDKDKEKNK